MFSTLAYAMEYMPSDEAKQFLAFLYNDSSPDDIDSEDEYDIYYSLLTGGYSADIDKEQEVLMSFLIFVNSHIKGRV